jgi:hypothetical protein
MRALLRFLLLFLAAYGPVAPVMLAFLLVMPPLLVIVDWPLWVKVLLLANDVVLVVALALWLGPGMIDEVRRFLRSEPPR